MRLFVLMTFFSILLFADGETIYKKKCASCHAGYIPMGDLKENFVEYNNTKLHLKAPALNQLSFRLKQRIGDPNGDKEMQLMEIEEFVGSYLYHPDKAKSICMEEVLDAFETMPSMKGKISEEEIEEVVKYIYDFDQKALNAHSVHYEAFDQALKKAKKEHKIIMIKATSPYCHYCKMMEREVLANDEVVKILKEKFISVAVNVYKTPLPMGLKYKVTPTFFFLNSEGKVLKVVPGAFDKEDFMTILKDIQK
jgi:thioredoxin-related protein